MQLFLFQQKKFGNNSLAKLFIQRGIGRIFKYLYYRWKLIQEWNY